MTAQSLERALSSLRSPSHLWAWLALYGVASLVHFGHNAEYIAFYPNMPAWLTREKVYLAWLAITGLGVSGAAMDQLLKVDPADWHEVVALQSEYFRSFGDHIPAGIWREHSTLVQRVSGIAPHV